MSDVPDPPKGLFEQRQFPDAPAANDVVKFPDRPPQQFIDDDNEENIEFPTDIPDMDASMYLLVYLAFYKHRFFVFNHTRS